MWIIIKNIVDAFGQFKKLSRSRPVPVSIQEKDISSTMLKRINCTITWPWIRFDENLFMWCSIIDINYFIDIYLNIFFVHRELNVRFLFYTIIIVNTLIYILCAEPQFKLQIPEKCYANTDIDLVQLHIFVYFSSEILCHHQQKYLMRNFQLNQSWRRIA